MSRSFAIGPRGPFSLAQAIGFGFGPREAAAGEIMRLAFAVDGSCAPAGVVLRQDSDGTLRGELDGDADLSSVIAQVARVLSLDADGAGWPAVGERDPVIGALQGRFAGLRPVLFHSPYEAAAWSVLSARRRRGQALRVRDELSRRLGTGFDLDGERLWAFPAPAALLAGVADDDERSRRLRGVAEAALDGRLDAARLHDLGPQQATEEVLALRGLGPFYAGLVVIRAVGFADVLPDGEPRLRRAVSDLYGPDAELPALAEAWRPYRTWAAVLLRLAAERG